MPSIELTSSKLRALVTPVLPFASDDPDLHPSLNAVLVRVINGQITATATDRYRIGVQRVTGQVDGDFTALVAVADVKHMLTVFKPARKVDTELRLTTGEDAGKPTITVEAVGGLTSFTGASLTYRQIDGQYPTGSVDGILAQALTPVARTTGGNDFAVNPHFLADFKAAAPRGAAMHVQVTGPHKPVAVTVGDDFFGVIMPLRQGDEKTEFATSWRAFFPATEPAKKAS